MLNRISSSMKVVLGCSAMLFLASACGSKSDKTQPEPVKASAPIKSAVLDEKPAMVNIAPPDVSPKSLPVETETTPAVEIPENFSGLIKGGKSLSASGNVDDALDYFARAGELRPNSNRPDIESARTLLTIGRSKDAREFVESALEKDEESSYAWNTLGRVELLEGNLEEAVAAFERAQPWFHPDEARTL
jgi:tetratricopeptide (TPR) repeat protein